MERQVSAAALPSCRAQNPSCGACGKETAFDETFYCEDCGLNYFDGDDYTTAEFLDEDADPCGVACDNTWHRDGAIKCGWGYTCHPCVLPGGHESDHWTPCEAREVTP